MNQILNTLLTLLLVLNLHMLGTSRLIPLIRSIALQGFLLSLLPFFVSSSPVHLFLLFGGVLLIKGILIPYFLLKAVKKIQIPREVNPYLGFTASLITGTAIILFSFWMGSFLKFPFPVLSDKIVPVAMATVITGMVLLIARRKAITEILGYLVLENGIYIFAVALAGEMPVAVEMGVLLDILVGIFIMGIVLFKIQDTLQDIDVTKLNALKD